MQALHTLTNYVVDKSTGNLQKRQGSARWNEEAFDAETKQIFHFIDTSQNELILVIANDKLWRYPATGTGSWGEIKKDGTVSHDFSDENFPYPFKIAGNRVYFADDADWYWGDYTILSASTSWQAGISPPVFNLAKLERSTQAGMETGTGASNQWSQLMVPGSPMARLGQQVEMEELTFFDAIELEMHKQGLVDSQGRIKVRIETDATGLPSGTLVSDDHETEWVSVQEVATADVWITFPFYEVLSLPGGTVYHLVLEGDTEYQSNWVNSTNSIRWSHRTNSNNYTNGHSESFSSTETDPPTDPPTYLGVWADFDPAGDFLFRFGNGLDTSSTPYQYKITARNSTYNEGGRPSQEIIFTTSWLSPTAIILSGITAYVRDPQVTHWDVYRTKASDVEEGGSIQYYFLVSAVSYTDTFRDTVGDTSLGQVLQSDDHYRLRDASGEEAIPADLELFRGRIWATISGEDTSYLSKVLEADISPLGTTGSPIFGAYPSLNKFETETSGEIRTLKTISYPTNQGPREGLVFYFDNSIGMITGTDVPLNPPNGYRFDLVVPNIGLIGRQAITTIRGRHVFVSRSGIYSFNGTQNMENLSVGFIQSILDDISDANLALTICHEASDGLWVALDADNDGTLESIYRLNLSGQTSKWEPFTYNFNINNFIIRNAGISRNQILVATDMADFFIRELEQSTSGADKDENDADIAVVGTVRTHPITGELDPNRKFIRSSLPRPLLFNELSITAMYADTSDPPSIATYTITVTDKYGTTTSPALVPTSINDNRGHRTGFRVRSDEADVQITQSSIFRDEIRILEVRWE